MMGQRWVEPHVDQDCLVVNTSLFLLRHKFLGGIAQRLPQFDPQNP